MKCKWPATDHLQTSRHLFSADKPFLAPRSKSSSPFQPTPPPYVIDSLTSEPAYTNNLNSFIDNSIPDITFTHFCLCLLRKKSDAMPETREEIDKIFYRLIRKNAFCWYWRCCCCLLFAHLHKSWYEKCDWNVCPRSAIAWEYVAAMLRCLHVAPMFVYFLLFATSKSYFSSWHFRPKSKLFLFLF